MRLGKSLYNGSFGTGPKCRVQLAVCSADRKLIGSGEAKCPKDGTVEASVIAPLHDSGPRRGNRVRVNLLYNPCEQLCVTSIHENLEQKLEEYTSCTSLTLLVRKVLQRYEASLTCVGLLNEPMH